MIRPSIIPNNQEREIGLYSPRESSEEALICLNCPLPSCKNNCSRYNKEKKKLKDRKKVD